MAILSKLQDYLRSRQVRPGTGGNYIDIGTKRCYMIKDGKEYNKFIKLYAKAVAHGHTFNINQQHLEYNYFVVDVDFKFPPIVDKHGNKIFSKRVYREKTIESIVSSCHKAILKYFDVPLEKLLAFVMEKEHPTEDKNGYIKDGIHIAYPFVGIHTNYHYVLINDIEKEVQEKNLLRGIPYINKFEDIFDKGIVSRTNWMLYGSCKPDGLVYKLTKIYDANYNAYKNQYSVEELVSLLSIREYDHTNCVPFKTRDTKQILKEKLKTFPNPVVKTVRFEKKITKNIEQDLKKERQDMILANYTNQPAVQIVTKNVLKNMEKAQKLVNLLDKSRAEDYHKWIRVGIALCSIHPSLIATWIDFSKKCPEKFDLQECEKRWKHFGKYGYSIGSLCLWAKEDNPKGYEEFRKSEAREHLIAGLKFTDYDVAKAVHALYQHEYICVDIKDHRWYRFVNHRWELEKMGYSLSSKLSSDLSDQYLQLSIYFGRQSRARDTTNNDDADQTNNTNNNDSNAKNGDAAYAIYKKLRNNTYKKNIMNECEKLFYDKKFYDKADENKDLIGFNNGVYNLETGEFRDGVPEDYITLSTKTNYYPFDATTPKAKWILNFIKQVQPNKKMREYVIQLLASFLQGHAPDEKFHMWTGTGCFRKGTRVLMADGTFKTIESISPNEMVMGADNQPKRVCSLIHNVGDMYRITPISKDNEKLNAYYVNDNHKIVLRVNTTYIRQQKILNEKGQTELQSEWYVWKNIYHKGVITGKYPSKHKQTKLLNGESYERCAKKMRKEIREKKNNVNKGDEFIIPVKDWLNLLSKDKKLKDIFYGYRTSGIDFPDSPDLDIDPYLLGVWLILGSPHSKKLRDIKKIKPVYKDLLKLKYITEDGTITNKELGNFYRENFLDSTKGKFIPEKYLTSSIDVRAMITCGIEDALNGKTNISCSNENLSQDICRLYSSLGYLAYIKQNTTRHSVWEIHIKEKCNETKLDIRLMGKEEYFGIELIDDSDTNEKRFFIDNYIVTSNSNGKSKLISLYQLAFGDYCGILSIALLTKKRGPSNAASPELAKTKGKRFFVMQEPEEGDKLNVGLLKELTGGDMIEARKLYSDPIEFKPQFKIILTCNKKPNITSIDQGTWRRIRLVEFKSKFVDKPDPKKPYQFKINKNLIKELPEYAETFMSYLIEEFKQYKKKGLIEPTEVTEFTEEYRKRSDMYLEFIKEELVKSKRGKIQFKRLYDMFKSWIRNARPKTSIPLQTELIEYLQEHGYEIDKNSLHGYAEKGPDTKEPVLDSDDESDHDDSSEDDDNQSDSDEATSDESSDEDESKIKRKKSMIIDMVRKSTHQCPDKKRGRIIDI